MTQDHYDLIVIGSGAGGGTLAFALRHSGARILLIERGDFIPREAENWQPESVLLHKRYMTDEKWYWDRGKPFRPGLHYAVGGNTKFYGAALWRLRREDFTQLEHEGGISPAWPITYEDLAPYYARAEKLYHVHGLAAADPSEPPRAGPFPYPPLENEPYIEALAERLRRQGLHPFPLPIGIDFGPGGACIRCGTCDAFPCHVDGKGDADVCCVRPALKSASVELMTNAYARRLLTDAGGRRVTAVEVERGGERVTISASNVVVSCGSANSAALLLRSASDAHPDGLGNSSGLVGRNYMVHNVTALLAVHPTRINSTVYQKTLSINDFYLRGGPGWPYPLGNVQLLGKLQVDMLSYAKPDVPKPILKAIAARSTDWFVMSEDLPDPDNRVVVTPTGAISLYWRPNNLKTHQKLVLLTKKILRRSGFPIILGQRLGPQSNSHMCGTLRFGTDPATSVLDPYCRSHDVENLYVVDGSFFPSSGSVNPALTIVAQSLRVADHLMEGMKIRMGQTSAAVPAIQS